MEGFPAESLRIGIVCHTGLGGSVRVAVGLAEALAARGHAVHLIARTVPLGARKLAAGVTFHGLWDTREPLTPHLRADWSRADLHSFLDLTLSVVESAGLDVLHFHYAVPFAELAARVGHRLGAARPHLLLTLHGTDVSTYGIDPAVGPVIRRSLAGLDAVTTVSNSYAGLSARVFGLDRLPHVIPNFVDVQKFRPVTAIAFPRRSSLARRPRLAHVSNFRQIKDPESMARVFLRVRNELDADLWLIGDGDGMSSVRSIVREARAQPHVRLFGLRREVHRILPRSDVLLLTSRTESFCLAALEAAACGIPVVAPRVGGLPEVVVDGETGLLFEPGDEEEATRAALRLLADAGLRSAMGRAAVERARLFSVEAIVDRYERLYRQVLDGGEPSSEQAPSGGLLIGAGA